MGCGSSRTQSSLIRDMYREPSEFDTCSTVVSGRDRGEPDGKEVPSGVGDSQKKEHQITSRNSVSRSPYSARKEDTVSRNKTNGRSEASYKNDPRVVFTTLPEHNECDVNSGDRKKTEGCRSRMEGMTDVEQVSPMRDVGLPEEDRDLLVAT